MAKVKSKKSARGARKTRIHKRMIVNDERPRLAVFRSNKHIYAQIIDDRKQSTIAAASTLSKELKAETSDTKGSMDIAMKVGELIAKKAKEKKIGKVCFDRGGYLYHGCVKALADGARKGGLSF